MKKLLASKKILISIAAVALGIGVLLAGLTGAWWYILPTDEPDTVDYEMGKLDIAVTLDAVSGTVVYQPGDTAWAGGATVENTGNIDAFVKLDFGVYEGSVIVSDVNFEIAFDEDPDNFEVEDGYATFYKSTAATPNYYLAISAGAKVIFTDCIELKFIGGEAANPFKDKDGEGPNNDGTVGMNNSYMEKTYSVALDWAATQVKAKAIYAKFSESLVDNVVADTEATLEPIWMGVSEP